MITILVVTRSGDTPPPILLIPRVKTGKYSLESVRQMRRDFHDSSRAFRKKYMEVCLIRVVGLPG